jgi:small subunit ribosomal protein S10
MPERRIRIKLKAYDHRVLDESAGQIVETAEQTGARVAGPVPLPTHIRKFCVIRSPNIDKDSREQKDRDDPGVSAEWPGRGGHCH